MAGDKTTQQLSVRSGDSAQRRGTALTILAHPDVRRVGERVRLVDVARTPLRVSRLEPKFESPAGERAAVAIDDSFVSRTPLVIRTAGDGFELESPAAAGVLIAGSPLDGVRRVTAAELADGITIELGQRVALLLHELARVTTRPPALGLVGESDAIDVLRGTIGRIAGRTSPVLIRGETGVGKELVARALHEASGRRGPLVAVNVAAIPASTASSALFGHVRGAFTGAVADLAGHFRDADGGTLFLDEIGEIPLDVQAMLLRAMESGEIQPVGASRALPVDVRLIAATDRDLESAVAAGRFRDALLHRLTGFQLAVPPLRARRDDIARLLVHFLREELAALGREALLDDANRRRPWLPAALVAALTRHAWPGNVRQLRNVVRQLAMTGHDRDELVLDEATRTALGLATEPGAAPADPPGTPTSAQVIAALERHKYSIGAAATELGVSRAKMYTLAERAGGIRTARDVAREEIVAALAATAQDIDAAAAKLRISTRALTLRMTELGIERG
ncbi:MAG TPA: sigma 54-interacting transcriptional regulator [Kofleriaceae bacterium]